ncbi:hypothetical protein B0H13DRAFT_1850616 [Mycena leptocephala]|nr:hypothetical protein B0H13DRAFT_1850616 [Mycena leptocephala]
MSHRKAWFYHCFSEVFTDEKLANKWAFENNHAVTFDAYIKLQSTHALGFRAFVDKSRCEKPADQLHPSDAEPTSELTLYIANGITMNSDGEPCSGGGLWLSPAHSKNRAVGVPHNLATSTSGGLTAILYVIQNTPRNAVLNFVLDSKNTIHKLTLAVPQLESDGWTAIRTTRSRPERIKTAIMLEKTRYAIRDQCGKMPNDEDIWKSIRHKVIVCDVDETMEHMKERRGTGS